MESWLEKFPTWSSIFKDGVLVDPFKIEAFVGSFWMVDTKKCKGKFS